MSNETIKAKLAEIQKELKVPKSQRNTFGNYSFRNCEDILEAVKPLLGDCVLTISDDIVHFASNHPSQVVTLKDSKEKEVLQIVDGDRFYIKATATISDENGSISATSFARESQNKKGMDDSQITGSASSYARKYALNGLFAIDDTKDADHPQGKTNTEPQSPEVPSDPTDDWMDETVEGNEETHFCQIHGKDLKERGNGIWDHRAMLNEKKEFDQKGLWHSCQGKGWFLSER